MEPNTLSISVRLRRRQTETAQVSVPITEDVMMPPKMAQAEKRMSTDY